jgi:peptidoglycan/LPS O-acetylase OafA/YrhL
VLESKINRPETAVRIGYVPEIDGLRALAVIAVMLFHLDASYLPGGFTGVDIFFVISGFVVTSSLADHQSKNLISLLSFFYARRLVRIMPALLVMLITTIIFTNLFIPDAWLSQNMDRSGYAAFLGVSNIVLATASDGYFSPRSSFNPFTHTWSLGIEEQFYLIFPFLIYWHHRRNARFASPKPVIYAVGLITLGSLLACFVIARINHSWAFYLIPARFWELGVGMLLRLTLPYWREALTSGRSTAVGGAGMLLVGVSLVIPEGPTFPFPLGLLPVLGTAALIATVCTPGSVLMGRFFGATPLVYVGLRSYSLYLWHWPIYVLMRWTYGLETLAQQIVAITLTIALGLASYSFVETPIRRGNFVRKLPSGRVVLAMLLLVGVSLTGAGAINRVGDRFSLTALRDRASWYADDRHPLPDKIDRCGVVKTKESLAGGDVGIFSPTRCRPRQRVVAIGDSHNLAYTPLYRSYVASTGNEVTYYFKSTCGYLYLNFERHEETCKVYYLALRKVIASLGPSDILFLPTLRLNRLIQPFGPETLQQRSPEDHAEGMAAARAILRLATAKGAAVVFEAPKPVLPAPPFRCVDWFNRNNPICSGGLQIDRTRIEAMRRWHLDAMGHLAGEFPRVSIWDPLPVLCPGTRCHAMVHGQPLYFDGDHVSGYANDLLLLSFSRSLQFASRPVSSINGD